jgi:hypothetical protein
MILEVTSKENSMWMRFFIVMTVDYYIVVHKSTIVLEGLSFYLYLVSQSIYKWEQRNI